MYKVLWPRAFIDREFVPERLLGSFGYRIRGSINIMNTHPVCYEYNITFVMTPSSSHSSVI
jgi:hypothetical protein